MRMSYKMLSRLIGPLGISCRPRILFIIFLGKHQTSPRAWKGHFDELKSNHAIVRSAKCGETKLDLHSTEYPCDWIRMESLCLKIQWGLLRRRATWAYIDGLRLVFWVHFNASQTWLASENGIHFVNKYIHPKLRFIGDEPRGNIFACVRIYNFFHRSCGGLATVTMDTRTNVPMYPHSQGGSINELAYIF